MITRIFILAAIAYTTFIFSAHASKYKLDQCFLESKFEKACEVPFLAFSETSENTSDVIAGVPNHFLVGLSSVILGTFGVHRFMLHQKSAGIKHLALTGVSLGLLFGAVAVANSQNGSWDTNITVAFFMALGAIALEASHIAYTIVEGVIYLITPQSKYTKKGGLLYDQSFFAPFKLHRQ